MTPDVGAWVSTGGGVILLAGFLVGCAVLMALALCKAAALGDEAELRAAIQPPEWHLDEADLPWPPTDQEHAA